MFVFDESALVALFAAYVPVYRLWDRVDRGKVAKSVGQRAIKLYLLPPKSPEINGAVERCNSSWRYEFYAVYDLPTRLDDLNPLIDAFQLRYNTYRPHAALGGKTPAQYLATRQANETPVSHMS